MVCENEAGVERAVTRKWKKQFLTLLYVGTWVCFPWVKFIPGGQEAHQKSYWGPILRNQMSLWAKRQNKNSILFSLFVPVNVIRTCWKNVMFCFSLGFTFGLWVVCFVGGRGHLISRSKSAAHRTCMLPRSYAHPCPTHQRIIWGGRGFYSCSFSDWFFFNLVRLKMCRQRGCSCWSSRKLNTCSNRLQ